MVSYSWKDPENVFRKHPKLQLTGVPTLMRWPGTVSKVRGQTHVMVTAGMIGHNTNS